jgi:23S rRNA (guanosine2251-2'-O)-methyltransferase
MAANGLHIELSTCDRTLPPAAPPLPVTLVLDRLRSAFNVGNIFRLAEALRAERIVTCGYTATPPHPKLAKTARGCDLLVPCEHHASAGAAVQALRDAGYWVCAVETAVGAAAVWDVPFRFPAALVFGNEALGVSADALAHCHAVACLPALGVKNSINVGNCAAVVLYEAWRQWLRQPARGEECS